jgi:DNA-binding MarR family transcriptional regulator
MESGVGKLTALSMISHNEGINQVMISKAIRRDKAAVARILHELESEGLIVRRMDPTTRRANTLSITKAGKEALQEYQRLTTECEIEFTNVLTDAERAQFLHILRKMRQHHSPDTPGI